MKSSSLLIRTVAIVLFLITNGCTSLKRATNASGNYVLDLVGVTPAKSIFNAGDGIVQSLKNPTPEEEYYLGRAVAASILTHYRELNNPALTEYLSKVGLVLSGFSATPATFGGYHFVVLDSDEINAVAAPGGFVFISKGMLEIIPDEDALAAILAHEVTHVAKSHGVKSLSDAKLKEALTSVGKIAGSVECSEVLAQAAAVFDQAVKDIADTLLKNGYSRELEFEADAGSEKILLASGYDASALYRVLQIVGAAEGVSNGGWLTTHPKAKDRMNALHNDRQLKVNQQLFEIRVARFKSALKAIVH